MHPCVCVFRRVISAAPVIKPFSRRRTPPLVAELDSAATMHANRIRMNEAAARMAPPRDHNFALRRWLKTPVLIPEEDSTDLTDLSSYERSHSISMDVKKMSQKENSSKSDDEGYESPVAPFREQLTDEELAQAIQKLLSKGIPVSQSAPQRDCVTIFFGLPAFRLRLQIWESGDVVRCTMLYLKFAREQADSCPEINRALGDSKASVPDTRADVFALACYLFNLITVISLFSPFFHAYCCWQFAVVDESDRCLVRLSPLEDIVVVVVVIVACWISV